MNRTSLNTYIMDWNTEGEENIVVYWRGVITTPAPNQTWEKESKDAQKVTKWKQEAQLLLG